MWCVDMLDKSMIHHLGGMEKDIARFHHTTQNSTQFKTYQLSTSGIFHLIFSDGGWPKGAETAENETSNRVVYSTVETAQALPLDILSSNSNSATN